MRRGCRSSRIRRRSRRTAGLGSAAIGSSSTPSSRCWAWRLLPRDLPPWRTAYHYFRRWRDERTLAWLGQNRRLSKDFECLCATGEALIYAAMSRLMLRRLARA
jgi:hypothetical protein